MILTYWLLNAFTKLQKATISFVISASGVPRGGVWGVQTPPEIPKISVESSSAWARSTGVSVSFCISLCSYTVVIY